MCETKNEKFARLATSRTKELLKKISLLNNLSNTGTYEYSSNQVNQIFTLIEKELSNCKSNFTRKLENNTDLDFNLMDFDS